MEPEGLFASAADADGVDQFAADHSTEQLAGAKRNALRDKTKCRRVRHAKSAAGHSWPPGSLPARVDAWPASPRRFQRVLDRRDDGGHVRTVSMGGASAAVLLRGLRAKAQGHADEDPISAQSCKVEFRSARRDARFCSDACGNRCTASGSVPFSVSQAICTAARARSETNSPCATVSGPSRPLRAAGGEARRGPKSVPSPPRTTVGAWNKGPARMQDRTGRSRPETSAPER